MRFALLVAAAMLLAPIAGDADARRKPPPEIKFCNTTRTAIAVATFNYAGRGQFSTRGWKTLAAESCETIAADRFHLRGRKKPGAFDSRTVRRYCVKDGTFRMRSSRDDLESKRFCDGHSGRLVHFYKPRRGVKAIELK